MAKATKDDIGNAIDWLINDWRETYRSALDNFKWPSIPGGDEELFKGAAMLNFGIDATKTLFPKSTAGSLITVVQDVATKHYAVPLWILGQAQDGFKKIHAAAVNASNKELHERFGNLRDQFVREIQKIARTYKNNPAGRAIADQVFPYVKDREFRDKTELDVFLRQVIHHARLIVTDPKDITKRVNEGFGGLCNKICYIWRASYHGPWTSTPRLDYADSAAKNMYASGYVSRNYKSNWDKKSQDWMIRNAWRMEVNFIDRAWYEKRQDVCQVTLIQRGDPVRAQNFKPLIARTATDLTKAVKEAEKVLRH